MTGDRQWIHSDPERAGETPLGGTIAHGYFTLALAPTLLAPVLSPEAFAMAMNYGLERVRLPAPSAGRRPRADAGRVDRVDEFAGGATLGLTLTCERAGGDKPVCVAAVLHRVYEGETDR